MKKETENNHFEMLETLVRDAVRNASSAERPGYMALFPLLERLRQSENAIQDLKSKFRLLKRGDETKGPFQIGVLLKILPAGDPENVTAVIGLSGKRWEVLCEKTLCSETNPVEGDEVVLDKQMRIVAFRKGWKGGVLAEIINTLLPEKTVIVSSGKDNEAKKEAGERIIPRLHVRMANGDEIIVEMAEELFLQGVERGDKVRIDPDLEFAFEKIQSRETDRLVIGEIPDVTFEEIGGLERQIEVIRDAVELPFIHRHLFHTYRLSIPKGMFLYGPPGCGKTMVAKAVANSLTKRIRTHLSLLESRLELVLQLRAHSGEVSDDVLANAKKIFRSEDPGKVETLTKKQMLTRLEHHIRGFGIDPASAKMELERIQRIRETKDGVRSFFLRVKGPELLNKYVGETENRIREIFDQARSRSSFFTPVVVFFDEMEALFRVRGSGRSSDIETTVVPQFLSEMDGMEPSENMIVIGASNRPEMIDPAIMRAGRLDIKIRIDRPGKLDASNIMALYLTPDLPLSMDTPPSFSSGNKIRFKSGFVTNNLFMIGRHIPAKRLQEISSLLGSDRDVRAWFSDSDAHSLEGMEDAVIEILRTAADREAFVEELISRAVEILYHPDSHIAAVGMDGKRHVFSLSGFISGAMLNSIVNRCKKAALKNRISNGEKGSGIRFSHIKKAIFEEISENAEQLAANRMQAEYSKDTDTGIGNRVRMVEVHLEEPEFSP